MAFARAVSRILALGASHGEFSQREAGIGEVGNSGRRAGSGDIDFEEFCVMLLRLKGLRRQQVICPSTHSCDDLWRRPFGAPRVR